VTLKLPPSSLVRLFPPRRFPPRVSSSRPFPPSSPPRVPPRAALAHWRWSGPPFPLPRPLPLAAALLRHTRASALPRTTAALYLLSLATRCPLALPPLAIPRAATIRVDVRPSAGPPRAPISRSPPPSRAPFRAATALSGHRAASCAAPRDPWPPLSVPPYLLHTRSIYRKYSIYIYTHTHTHTHVCMYVCICVRVYTRTYVRMYVCCVCVKVQVSEREREREREKKKKRREERVITLGTHFAE